MNRKVDLIDVVQPVPRIRRIERFVRVRERDPEAKG